MKRKKEKFYTKQSIHNENFTITFFHFDEDKIIMQCLFVVLSTKTLISETK